jgi:hypothetical protein
VGAILCGRRRTAVDAGEPESPSFRPVRTLWTPVDIDWNLRIRRLGVQVAPGALPKAFALAGTRSPFVPDPCLVRIWSAFGPREVRLGVEERRGG